MDSLSSSSSSSSSTSSSSMSPNVVIRGGHIIPSIRLTPPDSRPAMSPSVPEQDLGSSSLFVPLRTEEVGWEEGGLIWAAKRYFYPTVNLYGGSDDHVIGTYRGGPAGYRFVKITDKDFALASSTEDEECSHKESKTSSNGTKSSLPKGPATKLSSHLESEEASTIDTIKIEQEARQRSLSSSSASSSPSSSRRGSNSTEDDDNDSSSGADTGVTTPTSEASLKGLKTHSDKDMADELQAALCALQHDDDVVDSNEQPKKTRMLASRAGAGEICTDPVDASRLAGPIKSQLYNNGLGFDRSLTLSDSVPAAHFQEARGRSRSRRSQEAEYSAGWSYEHNMQQQHQ